MLLIVNWLSDPAYTIQLINGGTTSIPSFAMDKLVDHAKDAVTIQLAQRIHYDSKVNHSIGRTTHQGRLHLGSGNLWSSTVQNILGSIIKQIPNPNLPFTYQTLINDSLLQPWWLTHPTFSAFHVSAKDLQNPCPITLTKALDSTKVDHDTAGIVQRRMQQSPSYAVCEEITLEQVRCIQNKCGRLIPTMCVLIIKSKDGYPHCTKCRIVAIGNQQQHNYSKSDK